MAGAGFTTTFDYVRVFELAVNPVVTEPEPSQPPVPEPGDAPTQPADSATLAATGVDALPLFGAVVSALAAGFALLLEGSRRSRAAAVRRR